MRMPSGQWLMVFGLIGVTWFLLRLDLPPMLTGGLLVAMVVLMRMLARSMSGA
jgi:hypothetical protein